jgi:hypothetical protein
VHAIVFVKLHTYLYVFVICFIMNCVALQKQLMDVAAACDGHILDKKELKTKLAKSEEEAASLKRKYEALVERSFFFDCWMTILTRCVERSLAPAVVVQQAAPAEAAAPAAPALLK